MDTPIEAIREREEYLFNKYKLNFYKNNNKKQYINKRVDYIYLLLTTNMKFIDILQKVRNKYNRVSSLNQTEKDIMQSSFKFICLYYNIPLEDIKNRYSDKYEEVEVRMMFRIELYKEGWEIEQIERYIYKYLLKQVFIEEEIEYYKHIYHNFMIRREIYKKEKEYKLGRPSLPKSIKEYIKSKHKHKIRNNMRLKYTYSNEYERIKNNLFTKEEVEEILENIKNVNIINKVKNLKLLDITIKE